MGKSQRVRKHKLTEREQEVCAAVLGVSNLGFEFCIWGHGGKRTTPDRDALRILKREGTSHSYCFNLTSSLAENDEMMDGFQDEVKRWRRDVRKWTREYVIKVWPEMAMIFDQVIEPEGDCTAKNEKRLTDHLSKREALSKEKFTREEKERWAGILHQVWNYIAADADQLEGRLTRSVIVELVCDAGRPVEMGGMTREEDAFMGAIYSTPAFQRWARKEMNYV